MINLDIFIEELSKKSERPIKEIYNITINSYIIEEEKDEKKEIIYDELIYYYLTDFDIGIENSIELCGYSNELEKLKEIIAFSKTKSDLDSLSSSVKKINKEIKLHSKEEQQNLMKYILMSLTYISKDYIAKFVDFLVNTENINPDDLIAIINKKIMNNKTTIFKITN